MRNPLHFPYAGTPMHVEWTVVGAGKRWLASVASHKLRRTILFLRHGLAGVMQRSPLPRGLMPG
jgi:hypothetical protein